MTVGILPPGEPGIADSLLLPQNAEALAAGEPVTALTLTDDSLAVGALAGYLKNGYFQITSLYIAPDYRREGGGRMLLERLAEMLEGCASGMEIRFITTSEEHETLFPFLEAMGFQKGENHGETIYLTTFAAAQRSHLFKGSKTAGVPFSQIDSRLLKTASKAAEVSGAPLPVNGLKGKTVDPDISVAVVENGQIQAYAAFDTAWSGGLTLAALWSKSSALLPELLNSAASQVQKKYPSQTRLAVQAVNDISASLIPVLLPEARPISFTYYYLFN